MLAVVAKITLRFYSRYGENLQKMLLFPLNPYVGVGRRACHFLAKHESNPLPRPLKTIFEIKRF